MTDPIMLLVFSIIIQGISILALTISWFHHHARYQGISHWIIGISLLSLGHLIMIGSGYFDSRFFVFLADMLIVIGALIAYVGMTRFFGRETINRATLLVVAGFVLLFTLFTFVVPDIMTRAILFTMFAAFLLGILMVFLNHAIKPVYQKITLFIKVTASLFVVINLARLVIRVAVAGDNGFESPAYLDALYHHVFNAMIVLLTISFINLVTRRLEIEVVSEENKFVTSFYAAPYAILLTRSTDGLIADVNDAFVKTFGYDKHESIGRHIRDLGIWMDASERQRVIQTIQETAHIQGHETVFRHKDGHPVTVLLSSNEVMIEGESYLLSSVNDITLMSEAKKELEFLANHDVLTELPNRRYLRQYFDQVVKQAVEQNRSLTMALIDMDRFKAVNDQYGHDIGDQTLFILAARLLDMTGHHGLVGRLGGDEFVVIMPDMTDARQVEKLLEDMVKACEETIEINGRNIMVSAAYGYTVVKGGDAVFDQMIRQCDKGLYNQKKRKLNKNTQ
ncbi:MAG: diguanylate cyclase [Acholeplasmataceae bacterium]|nr:MAG: diguanylate cyclase [Acholeplasmataceae bacterium]